MKLSEALYNKRCESQKTQKQVCDEIGLCAATYSFLESGNNPHKRLIPKVAGKLSKYLGIPPLEIMSMFKEDLK